MTLVRQVRGEGPIGADICVVGEAPSVEELASGRPFVGPSGKVLRRALAEAGVPAVNVRFENVVERKLEGNNFQALYDASGLPGNELLEWQTDLQERICKVQPKVIVSLGEHATRIITGRYDLKISQSHCYMLSGPDLRPVIPAFHPAFIFRQPDWGHWLTCALRKASSLAASRSAPDSAVTMILSPSVAQIITFFSALDAEKPLSVDIECTLDTKKITCIGFATDDNRALVIPFTAQFGEPFWPSEEVEKEVWRLIKDVLESSQPKIFQNMIFDTMILWQHGITVAGMIYDTMLQANFINPELPKSLADLGRLYCYCEPWKQMNEASLGLDPITLWRYNAYDVTKTYKIHKAQWAELANRKLADCYLNYVQPLNNRIFKMCIVGMPIDHERLEVIKKEIEGKLEPIKARLVELGSQLIEPAVKVKKVRNKLKDTFRPGKGKKPVIDKKGYDLVETKVPRMFNPASPMQVKEALKMLGYQIPTQHFKETTDRKALLKLNRKTPHEFIGLLLRHGKYAKLVSSYLSVQFESDGRCRFSVNKGSSGDDSSDPYKVGTKSGRFSCAKTPWGTGLNIQTIPRKDATIDVNLREIFIADSGNILIQADLSQAELRVVAWLSGDETLTNLLAQNADVHQFVADKVKELTGLECPRQLGKRINHASNYGMGANKFADSCLLEADLAVTPAEAKKLLEARSKAFPRIAMWHKQIEDQIYRTRRLVTPQGRQRYFFSRITDDTIREALSFIPQATVVDTLNAAWVRLTDSCPWISVMMQGHDSLLMQVPKEQLDQAVEAIDLHFGLAQNIVINGIKMVIPWDITYGDNWGNLKKYVK